MKTTENKIPQNKQLGQELEDGMAELGNSKIPPAFGLTASNVVQRSQAPSKVVETSNANITQIIRLRQNPDNSALWKFIQDNRAILKNDPEASKWIDNNFSVVGNWRVDTIIEEGEYKNWSPARIQALATSVHSKLPSKDRIQTFLASTDVTNEFKLQLLGRIIALVGQAEYLLGTMYHKGKAFEDFGPFEAKYRSTVGYWNSPDAWCTMFAAYLHSVVGFRDSVLKGGPMWSNSRLNNWHQHSKRTADAKGDFSTPADYKNYSGDGIYSGTKIKPGDWENLIKPLKEHYKLKFKTEEDKNAALTNIMVAFFKGRIKPQPGDIISIPNWSEGKKYGHTITVEAFDESTWTISTVEGNLSNRILGRTIDLRANPGSNKKQLDASSISQLIRPGLEFYKKNPNPDGEREKDGVATTLHLGPSTIATTSNSIAEGLIAAFADTVAKLRGMAQQVGAVGGGETVAEMSQGKT